MCGLRQKSRGLKHDNISGQASGLCEANNKDRCYTETLLHVG